MGYLIFEDESGGFERSMAEDGEPIECIVCDEPILEWVGNPGIVRIGMELIDGTPTEVRYAHKSCLLLASSPKWQFLFEEL